ncbi:MAG TPA: hypothetical protein VK666_10910 [Chryseolinea sp.]|nr:hypothetical protein [Chryseolinea sp.]
MRISFCHLLLALLLAVLTPAGVYCIQAQDASYPLQDADDSDADLDRDKVIYAGGEADPLLNNKIHITTVLDSSLSKPSRNIKPQPETAKNSAKPASQEDDSILSFNFLYYIFEKYKLQDMVD